MTTKTLLVALLCGLNSFCMAAPEKPKSNATTSVKIYAAKSAHLKEAEQEAQDTYYAIKVFEKEFKPLLIEKNSTFDKSIEKTRHEVLKITKSKIPPTGNNLPREDHTYPMESLFDYLFYCYEEYLKDEPQDLYLLVYNDLNLSQKLLKATTLQDRRRGLWVADFVAGQLSFVLRERKAPDAKLYARIYDVWIMPNFHYGRSGIGQELSRLGILRKAFHIYEESGEKEKSYATLRMVIPIAESVGAIDQADQARIRLATALNADERYAEAIKYLQEIKQLTEAKEMLPKMKQKWEEQKSKQNQGNSED